MVGAVCSVEWTYHAPSDTTIENIVIRRAYWRGGVDEDFIYPCAMEARSCKGGGGDGTADYCNEGYSGPWCATCERYWFRRVCAQGWGVNKIGVRGTAMALFCPRSARREGG